MKKEVKEDFEKREKYLMDKEYELIEMISILRNEKKLSQRALCELIDIQQPSLVRIEKGRISPGIDTVLKILYPLGYTIKFEKIDDK